MLTASLDVKRSILNSQGVMQILQSTPTNSIPWMTHQGVLMRGGMG